MTTIHRLEIEPMTEQSFAPYGELWDTEDRPADRRLLISTGYSYGGRTTVSTIWQPRAEMTFNLLERHFGVTQSFIQMSGSPAVVCVAPATASEAPTDVPEPADVRAFRIDPTKAYSFNRGTWHSLNRLVLSPPGASFLILNSDPNPTQMIDYETGAITVHADLGASEPERMQHERNFDTIFEVVP